MPSGTFSPNRIDLEGVQRSIRFVATATAYTYQVGEFESFLFCDPTLHAIAVYLPPVGQSAGRKIIVTNKAAANTVIYPFTGSSAGTNAPDSKIYDGTAGQTSQTLTNVNGFTVLECDGEKWIAMKFDLTGA
jgi:hypothetical protein